MAAPSSIKSWDKRSASGGGKGPPRSALSDEVNFSEGRFCSPSAKLLTATTAPIDHRAQAHGASRRSRCGGSPALRARRPRSRSGSAAACSRRGCGGHALRPRLAVGPGLVGLRGRRLLGAPGPSAGVSSPTPPFPSTTPAPSAPSARSSSAARTGSSTAATPTPRPPPSSPSSPRAAATASTPSPTSTRFCASLAVLARDRYLELAPPPGPPPRPPRPQRVRPPHRQLHRPRPTHAALKPPTSTTHRRSPSRGGSRSAFASPTSQSSRLLTNHRWPVNHPVLSPRERRQRPAEAHSTARCGLTAQVAG